MLDPTPFAAAITAATGRTFRARKSNSIGGGSIHSAWLLADGSQRYFVKTNAASALPMFAAEAAGLAVLRDACAVRTPQVVACGTVPGHAYLVLEWLELQSLGRDSGARLGRSLAALHRNTRTDHGGPADNFIGATPQQNQWSDNWPRFYAQYRLRPQLQLVASRGMDKKLVEQGERLAEKMAAFFVAGHPAASLLHGDLWSGNAAQLADGTPVIYDPASYYGDRATDIAMAELFGGFPESFYAAYREAWPLGADYETKKTLYNLYHVLNHYNLFGAGYLGQARRMIEKLLAELRG